MIIINSMHNQNLRLQNSKQACSSMFLKLYTSRIWSWKRQFINPSTCYCLH